MVINMAVFKKVYFSWQGRISRKTYWVFSIPLALIAFLSGFLSPDENADFPWVILIIILIILLYPSLMINIKRAHDRNRTGWFSLVLIVPIISLWPLIELGFLRGSDGPNKYGDPDKIWDKNA